MKEGIHWGFEEVARWYADNNVGKTVKGPEPINQLEMAQLTFGAMLAILKELQTLNANIEEEFGLAEKREAAEAWQRVELKKWQCSNRRFGKRTDQIVEIIAPNAPWRLKRAIRSTMWRAGDRRRARARELYNAIRQPDFDLTTLSGIGPVTAEKLNGYSVPHDGSRDEAQTG